MPGWRRLRGSLIPTAATVQTHSRPCALTPIATPHRNYARPHKKIISGSAHAIRHHADTHGCWRREPMMSALARPRHSGFDDVVGDATIEMLASGFGFLEGPVWHPY